MPFKIKAHHITFHAPQTENIHTASLKKVSAALLSANWKKI